MSDAQVKSARPTRKRAPASAPAAPKVPNRVGRRSVLDLGSGFGLALAGGLLALVVLLSGAPLVFLNPSAILIVIGGTLAVTLVSFPLREVLVLPAQIAAAMTIKPLAPRKVAETLVQLAEHARRAGAQGLRAVVPKLSRDEFLLRAVEMIVDGIPADQIENMLSLEIELSVQRASKHGGLLRRAGEIAPAMGLIGTLLGLVQMLTQLNDPDAIGPGMAVALLTTLYGAILSNMVLLPLAVKLERNAEDDLLIKQLTVACAGSIARQENPRRLEVMLNTLLPPHQRLRETSAAPE